MCRKTHWKGNPRCHQRVISSVGRTSYNNRIMGAKNTPLQRVVSVAVFGPSFIRNQWQKQNSSRVVNGPYVTAEDEAKVKTLPHVRWWNSAIKSAIFVWAFPDFGGDSSIFVPRLWSPRSNLLDVATWSFSFQPDNWWERVDGSGKRPKLSESSSIGFRNFSMDTNSLIMPFELIKEPNSSRPMNL